MLPVEKTNSILTLFQESASPKGVKNENPIKTDSIEISNTAKVYDNVNKFLNLGNRDRLNLEEMNGEEKKEYLKMMSTLIKKGVVGYEVLEVNGKPEKHFVETQIGDERIYGAKLYKKRGYNRD